MPITITLDDAAYAFFLEACLSRIRTLERRLKDMGNTPGPPKSGTTMEPQACTSSHQSLVETARAALQNLHNAKTHDRNRLCPKVTVGPTNSSSFPIQTQASRRSCTSSTVSINRESLTLAEPYWRQQKSPLFRKLPLELRVRIYEHLLVSNEVITPERQAVGEQRDALEDKGLAYVPAAGLDATLLQSCQAMYHEGYPVLYGKNVFEFCDSVHISHFRNHRREPGFDQANTKTARSCLLSLKGRNGRLETIRKVIFDLSKNHSNCYYGLELNWKLAAEDFIKFPALQNLQLNFKGWEPTTHRGQYRFLRRILSNLKTSGPGNGDGTIVGLNKLTFIGVCDDTLSEQLRSLLRPDGDLNLGA